MMMAYGRSERDWNNFGKFTTNFNLKPRQLSGNLRGAYDKFPDFFRIGTFIDSTHMKL